MDNSPLKNRLKRFLSLTGQVGLEFALAFIVILVFLFIPAFNLWQDLNQRFVEDTTKYQAERVESGQGNITIPGQPPILAGMPQLDDATLNKIAKIQ